MPLKVLIVGGGIAGLAAAAALATKGHNVTVFERVDSATEVGFAFRITPNSDRCLKYLGIDTIEGGAVAVKALRMLDQNGDIIFERKENDGEDQDQNEKKSSSSQGTSVFAFRPQVTQQLLDICHTHGVTIKTGIKVSHIDTAKTTITLDDQDNTILHADLIIGCDGLHSIVRPFVINTDTTTDNDTQKYTPKSSTNDNCLRFVIPTSAITSDPTLSSLLNDTFNLASWKAGRKRILAYPVDYGKQYNLVCTHPEELSDDVLARQGEQQDDKKDSNENGTTTHSKSQSQPQQTYNTHISLSDSLEIYSDLDPRVHSLFNLADSNGFRVWKLQDIDEIPTWSRGHTLLIGDAAHAVLPFGFSGASMAIEDAVVLGEVLGSSDSDGEDASSTASDDLGVLLKRFEEARKPRVAHVREMSRAIGGGMEDPKSFNEYFEFLGDYDAVEVGRGVRSEWEGRK